jgi:thiamine biosynthesis lipoprotein
MKVKYLVLALAVILCGCGENNAASPVQRTEFALGTYVSVRIAGMGSGEAEPALDAAFERLHEIELIASAKNTDSELFYVNENAYGRDVAVSEELFFLLETGLYYSALNGGAFDITLGAIVELWGIGADAEPSVPADADIRTAVENSGFEHLILNPEARTVRFLREHLRLDLGAFAKGYAADEMARVLRENGVTDAVLDLGGDIITIGDNEGKGWRIGIADPRNPAQIRAIVTVSDTAVVTSGDYERYFMHENTRCHHIFDRNTGYPADSGVVSTTVITDSAMLADVFSTALFVEGVTEIPHFVMNYIFIDSDMNLYYSESIEIEIIN